MRVRTADYTADLVPLDERMRYLRWFRVGAVLAVFASWLALPDFRQVPLLELGISLGAYLVITLGGEGVWKLTGRRSLPLFGVILMIDGAFLAWVTYALAGTASPVRFLILIHLITVALLASYRTGLKLALWDTLLLLMTYHAQEGGLIPTPTGENIALGDTEFRLLVSYILVFWVVVIVTAAFSAVNERELRRRRYDLEALAKFSLRLESVTKGSDVAEILTETVADEFGFERIVFFGAREGDIFLMHGKGAEELPPDAPRPGEGQFLARIASSHETLLVSKFDAEEDPGLAALLPGCQNLVMAPLNAEGRSVGLLICEHGMRSGSRIERRVISMLERLVSQSALALQNAWLLEMLERYASTDGLTGIANRRSFEEALGRDVSKAIRTQGQLSLVMLDIDHFKQLNDVHGHVVGDRVLRRVAEILDREVRGADMVARYGGEEFVMIVSGLGEADAVAAAERLRTAIELDSSEPRVTASFGVATYPDDSMDGSSLLEAADTALYQSKHDGRNRVTAASTVRVTQQAEQPESV
jgi:diguanylate cyclase (GGDEF)-like protein